jgi:type III pantothenate kinase
MILLLDIGNTFLKWVVLDGDAFIDEGEILHADEDKLGEVFADAWQGLQTPLTVYACNVAGDDFAEQLDDWLQAQWQLKASYLLSEAESHGVHNAYKQPATLGVDRWMAMLAAWDRQHSAVCVIDCGMALTVDAIDSKGYHLGGLIAPGLGMMRDCLLDGTEGIDFNEEYPVETPESLLAHDTRGAVEVGGLYAVLAFIERVSNELERELGEGMQCIITGGDADDIVPLLGRDVLHRPQLVLEGMALQVLESQ